MANLISGSSTWASGTPDTASSLQNGVDEKRAEHINGVTAFAVALQGKLGAAASLVGTFSDLASRLSVAILNTGKLKDFSAATKETFPPLVSEGGTGVTTFSPGGFLTGNGASTINSTPGTAGRVVLAGGTGIPTFATGLRFHGPGAIGAGSTRSHEGIVTISSNQALSGVHFYTSFVLNPGITITPANGSRRLIICASESITINGTIAANGKGAPSGGTVSGSAGLAGTDAAGGGGGNGGGGEGAGSGGSALWHGIPIAAGGAVSTAGTATPTGEFALLPIDPFTCCGGASGGTGGSPLSAHSGGPGGATVVLIAPVIILGNTAIINTSGTNGSGGGGGTSGGGGGGGAGNIYLMCQSLTDSGCTFVQAGGLGGSGSTSGGGAGGNGASGIRQTYVFT